MDKISSGNVHVSVSYVEGHCVSTAGCILIACWSYTNFNVSFLPNTEEWKSSLFMLNTPSILTEQDQIGLVHHGTVIPEHVVSQDDEHPTGSDILWLQHFWFEWFAPYPK